MMEADRVKKKLVAPDLDTWNKEMYTLRVFNQLIYNTDDNLTNVLISPDGFRSESRHSCAAVRNTSRPQARRLPAHRAQKLGVGLRLA